MSRNATCTQFFGDGKHDFRLGIAELEELQEKTDSGPLVTLGRLQGGSWFVADVLETIRLGLIGGGAKPLAAATLAERYAAPAYLMDAVPVAQAVLLAALVGAPEEDAELGEPKGEGTMTPPSPTAS